MLGQRIRPLFREQLRAVRIFKQGVKPRELSSRTVLGVMKWGTCQGVVATVQKEILGAWLGGGERGSCLDILG